jgi:hypothetical protein
MKNLIVVVTILIVPSLGCVTSLPRDTPFSEAWYKHQRHEIEFKERKDRIDNGEWVLAGKKDAARAAVQMDEEGKPKLNVGKRKGLSADLDADLDKASIFFKYKWGWKIRPKAE